MKKAKFNIVDILVLVVLIAGIAFVGLRMFGGSETPAASENAGTGTYRVTFQADAVSESVANTLVLGSKSENASRNVDLGTLVEFSTGESVVYGFDSKGNCVQSVKPGYVSVTLVCELTGTQQPTGLQVGQYMVNIGHTTAVRCGNTEISAVIVDIQSAS